MKDRRIGFYTFYIKYQVGSLLSITVSEKEMPFWLECGDADMDVKETVGPAGS